MGFWTDWLDPNIDGEAKSGKHRVAAPPGSDARSKWDKLAGVPSPSLEFCNGCRRDPSRCNCDPKLGRPRRWYE